MLNPITAKITTIPAKNHGFANSSPQLSRFSTTTNKPSAANVAINPTLKIAPNASDSARLCCETS